MGTALIYLNSDGTFQQVFGSDKRINTSSRADSRSFYISRDAGQSYVLFIEDDDAAADDLVAYIKNTSSTLHMFIRKIEVSSENAATFKLAFGDDTTATGTTVTAANLNRGSSNSADATSLGNGAVGGVTAETIFDSIRVPANDSRAFELNDSLVLGQNDNIVIEYDTGTTGDIEIEIFFYMDTL